METYSEDCIRFAQELVRTRSCSDNEGDLARLVRARMEKLGYDEVFFDRVGNVVGRIGSGPKTVLFDSHMDTVEVNDEAEWTVPPFKGEIVDGRLYGRGSVDTKSALSASVYAGAAARKLGLDGGKTIYVTGSVCEEFCDGESLKMLFAEHAIRPDYAVICEPSDNKISLGHKGKAQILLTTYGVSAHGSAPEKGVNAVYAMAEIIQRVDALNGRLGASGAIHGTVVLSDISCKSVSLNAVPNECSIYLDRRLVPGENVGTVRREIDAFMRGKYASWAIGTLRRTTWTGAELVYDPLHDPWEIARDHPLTLACDRAYERVYGVPPAGYDFWDFSSNAVTPVSMDIPTIGFGPGEYKLAHMRDENCEVEKIREACRFYVELIREL